MDQVDLKTKSNQLRKTFNILPHKQSSTSLGNASCKFLHQKGFYFSSFKILDL